MSTFMFKWTDKGGVTDGGNTKYKYDLPTVNYPGNWHCKNGKKIVVCRSGFHCTGLANIVDFIAYGPELYLAEVDGKYDIYRHQYSVEDSNKVAVEKIRLYYRFDIPSELIKRWNAISDDYHIGTIEHTALQKEVSKYILDNYELPIGTVDTIRNFSSKTGNLKNTTFADTFAPGSF